MELRDTRWADDIELLIETIQGIVRDKAGAVAAPRADAPPPSSTATPEASRRDRPARWTPALAVGALVAAVAIIVALWRGSTSPAERPPESPQAVDAPAPDRVAAPAPTAAPEAAKAPPASAPVEARPTARRASTAATAKSTCGGPDECEKECAQGIGNACTNLGVIYRQTLSYDRAAALYQKGCDAGDAQGCAEVGDAYMTGMGVTQDSNRAATYLQKGCDGGASSGCLKLAIMVSPAEGFGLARDDIRAARLNQRGCDLGVMASCGNLAEAYEAGRGVLRSTERAVALYTRACDGKDAASCDELGYLYEKGIGIPKDEARAVSFYEKACAVTGLFARSTSGCRHLASAYEQGRGVSRDLKRALELFRQACGGVTGSKEACADAKRLESEASR